MDQSESALITGVTGFAGSQLAKLLNGLGLKLIGISRGAPSAGFMRAAEGIRHYRLDLTSDREGLCELLAEHKPAYIFHLAALASVANSWREPDATISSNVDAARNLLEAARQHTPDAALVIACSGEQFGPLLPEELPVGEGHPLRPQSPYALSKAWVDLLGGFHADAFGQRIIRARAFNHIGPGQSDTYAAASFARQVAEAEASGLKEVAIKTGNIDVKRDFSDVRDVVRAYWLLAQRAGPGAYNVCSGRSLAIRQIIEGLGGCTKLNLSTETDPARLREGEIMEIRGSNEKLRKATGWQPQIELNTTLSDSLNYWRDKVRHDE